MLSAAHIVTLQDDHTAAWHTQVPEVRGEGDGLDQAVLCQHLANFELWHAEDAARTPGATALDIAQVKRRIDVVNQRRNDLVEAIDAMLLRSLGGSSPGESAELHSETPGLMIDRLSILSLKLFHTREELNRLDAPEGHFARNRERLAILAEQRADLAGCLALLWKKILAGERRFKLYRQLKMYNDPALNPAVYGAPEL